jgi:hypothetical protein
VLYLGYIFAPTPYARAREAEFWEWMRLRQPWFYDGLGMVRETTWHREVTGPHAGSIHHLVGFDDDAGLARYRRALRDRAESDPAWEARRVEQDRWYVITARTVRRSLPVPMGLIPGGPATAAEPLVARRFRTAGLRRRDREPAGQNRHAQTVPGDQG